MGNQESLSVHDNWVYAQAIDYEQHRIVLHTVYPHVQPPEFTDVVFEDVVAHHFGQQSFVTGPYPANVLFDVEEGSAEFVVETNLSLFRDGWPISWSTQADLVGKLTSGGRKCFQVSGSCGLDGFVFAVSMSFRPRPARASLTDDPTVTMEG